MKPRTPFSSAAPLSPQELQELADLDHRALWKPFTQMSDYMGEEPLILVEGQGSWLLDGRGRALLDANASLWVNVHGHRVPEIVEAVQRQVALLDHATLLGPTNEPAIRFAAELLAVAPKNLSRVFYSDSGSTAVEVGLKMAFQYQLQCGHAGAHKRTRYLALRGAYHGDTVGAVSVGGIELFHDRYRPLLFDALYLSQPDYLRRPSDMDTDEFTSALLREADDLLDQHGDTVAALVIEPLVQGASGMVTYPRELLVGLVQRARQAGALILFDEVATGFGRTGEMFASTLAGIEPDLMALAKGISGGVLPLAATLATEEIHDAFLNAGSKTFFHGHSYTGNPIACAAGRASLQLFETNQVLGDVGRIGRRLGRGLAALEDHPHVAQVRRLGVMTAVELVQDKETLTPYLASQKVANKICRVMIERGIWIRPLGETVVVNPPFCLTDEEVDWLCAELNRAIDVVTDGANP